MASEMDAVRAPDLDAMTRIVEGQPTETWARKVAALVAEVRRLRADTAAVPAALAAARREGRESMRAEAAAADWANCPGSGDHPALIDCLRTAIRLLPLDAPAKGAADAG